MRATFISTLRLLARFEGEPASDDMRTAIERSYSLRDAIEKGFENVRALADAVLFESGPWRERDLAQRDRIRKWQPQLRVLLVLRVSLWNYGIGLPGFEMPDRIRSVQREFDEVVSKAIEVHVRPPGG